MMPCVVSATQGLVEHTWVVITCQSWEGSLMCEYLQRGKGSGIECILAAEMAGIFASHQMIFFFNDKFG